MVKVYVVTGGCYSDYGIERVFLDEEKAKKYASLSDNSYRGDRQVEVYDTDDEKEINEITYIRGTYEKQLKDHSNDEIDVEILKTNNLDDNVDSLTYNSFYDSSEYSFSSFPRRIVTIGRVIIDENYNEDIVKNKYKKVLQDMMCNIEYLLSTGWTDQMISDSLNNKNMFRNKI